jgi:antitoxin HicB
MISNQQYTYPANLSEQDDGTWLVTFRDLPDALTDGDSQENAFEEAVDCLGSAIAARLLMGEDIPAPSVAEDHEFPVPLSAVLSAKAVLHAAMTDIGISKSALARQMNCDEKEVRRLLDPRHASKIGRLEQALLCLGYGLSLTVTPTPMRRMMELVQEGREYATLYAAVINDKNLDAEAALEHLDRSIAIGREYRSLVSGEAAKDLLDPIVKELEDGAARIRRTVAQGKTPRRMPEMPPLADVVDLQVFRKHA